MASAEMFERAAAGFIIAAFIALAAHRAKSLDTSGAVAATVVGAAASAAGWSWGVLLVAYFVASTLLSRFRRVERERLTDAIVDKGGARDAWQVIANGGVFAASALIAPFCAPLLAASMAHAALGALAASAADTWATEIGTLFGGTPRSIRTLRLVPPGTSGGISIAGVLAMLAGAAFVAVGARSLGLTGQVSSVLVAGVAGALVDSLLGGTLQARRWCSACASSTERGIHHCGTHTSLAGGREWMSNDVVNLVATFSGGAVAAVLANV